MANPLGIVHPALKERMQMMFYPSFCTIEQVTETQDSFGAVTVTWSTLADHAELRCRLAPNSANEIHDLQGTYVVHSWTIALMGYYPGVTAKMRAVIDDRRYEVETVQFDGNQKLTRLTVRIVE